MQASLARVWVLVAIALPALVSLLVPMAAVDLAYQVRAGDLILATGAIPAIDTFTFSAAGAPWMDQQWLAQVMLALGYRVGGWELLAVLRAGLVVAITGLLLVTARLRGARPRTASILALLSFILAVPALALRPQLFAIALFALLLALIAGRGRHPRAFLLAPAIVVVWANVHGSFVLAPVLLGYAWLDDIASHRPSRRSLAVLAAGILATLVNPLGVGAWSYAVGIGASPLIAGLVSEWQRTTPFTVSGALFYLSAIGVLAVAYRARARLSSADWLWLATLLGLGVWAVRGLAWWPAGAMLVVAAALGAPVPDAPAGAAGHPPVPDAPAGAAIGARVARRVSATSVMAVLFAILIAAALPWWRPADALTGRQRLLTYAPSGLAAALRSAIAPGAKVSVPQSWGSWFEWAVPDATYLVDARFELFSASVWSDANTIAAGGTAASAVLDRLGVDAVVVPTGGAEPAGAWTMQYQDVDGALLLRAPVR